MAEKLTPREKRAIKHREAVERAEAVFGTGKGSAEPKINVLTYDIDLLKALNYYNSAFDDAKLAALWWWPEQSAEFIAKRGEYADKYKAS